MYIGKQLLTLDIIVSDPNNQDTEQNSVLKANHTEWLMRSTLAECLNEREEILTARGYKIPQDWEFSWGARGDLTWTPNLNNAITLWNQPGNITPFPTDVTRVSGWDDSFDPTKALTSTLITNSPTLVLESSGVSSGFEGITPNAHNKRLESPTLTGNYLGMTGNDTSNAACFLVINTKDFTEATTNAAGVCIIAQNTQGGSDFDCTITSDGLITFEYDDVRINMSNNCAQNTTYILTFIKTGPNALLYAQGENGNLFTAFSTSLAGKSISGSSNRVRFGDVGVSGNWSHAVLNEVIIFNSNVPNSTECPVLSNQESYQKVEGYLAKKYNIPLPINHLYNNTHPTQSVI